MSAIFIGNITGQLIERADFEFVISKDNGVSCTSVLEVEADIAIALAPKIGTTHPLLTSTKLVEVHGRRSEGDRCVLTCTYKGMAPGATPQPIYERISGSTEEPIETHPRYKALTDAEFLEIKKWSADPAYVPAGLGDKAKELLNKKQRGRDTYLCATFGYRQTLVSNVSDNDCSKVGYIDTPPNAPPLAAGGNYLLLSYPQTQEGSVYRQIKEWRASGPDGWDADTYTAPL